MATQITDTGIKGFLKWYKREQPAIYAKVAPIIAAKLPSAFSDYHAGGWKTAGMSRAQVNAMMNKQFHGLGDDTIDISDDLTDVESAGDLIGGGGSPATVDVSTAANSGASSSSIGSAISSIITGASSLYMTSAQVSAQQQVLNAQLARAAAGLPPLSTTLSSTGVPTVTGTALSGGLILAAGAALVLVMVMSGRKSR